MSEVITSDSSALVTPFNTVGGFADKIADILGERPNFLSSSRTALRLSDPSQAKIMEDFGEIEFVVADFPQASKLADSFKSDTYINEPYNLQTSDNAMFSNFSWHVRLPVLPRITKKLVKRERWSLERFNAEMEARREEPSLHASIRREAVELLIESSKSVAAFLAASASTIATQRIGMTFGNKSSKTYRGFHQEPSGIDRELREAFANISGSPLVFAPGAASGGEALASTEKVNVGSGSMVVYRGQTPDGRGAFHGNNWGGHTRIKASAYIPLAA